MDDNPAERVDETAETKEIQRPLQKGPFGDFSPTSLEKMLSASFSHRLHCNRGYSQQFQKGVLSVDEPWIPLSSTCFDHSVSRELYRTNPAWMFFGRIAPGRPSPTPTALIFAALFREALTLLRLTEHHRGSAWSLHRTGLRTIDSLFVHFCVRCPIVG